MDWRRPNQLSSCADWRWPSSATRGSADEGAVLRGRPDRRTPPHLQRPLVSRLSRRAAHGVTLSTSESAIFLVGMLAVCRVERHGRPPSAKCAHSACTCCCCAPCATTVSRGQLAAAAARASATASSGQHSRDARPAIAGYSRPKLVYSMSSGGRRTAERGRRADAGP
jgi:hypothetical protein